MNNSEYTISATLPIQTGKGKVEIPVLSSEPVPLREA